MNRKAHIEIVEVDERDLSTKHIEADGPIAAFELYVFQGRS